MKKTLILLLICAVITFNTACSKSNSPEKNDTNTDQTETVVSNNNTGEKPSTTTEVKPEVKPETKPEVKPEAKPQAKPSSKPSSKPQPKPVTKPENSILNGELKGIIEKIYSLSEVKLPKTGLTEVTAKNSKYYLGTENVKYTEALASEPLMGSCAHSLVLLRVKDGADIDKIKAEIKDNIDPRKWICVGVEKDKVIVDNIGNLIILIMDNESDKFHKAFLSLAK